MNGVWYLKDLSVLNIHPTLVEILEAVQKRWGLATITSAYRPGDPGVHGQMPTRGVDLRSTDVCDVDVLKRGHDIAAWVNEQWEYDPDRPGMVCAIYHNAGSGWHLHIQVHENTRRV